MKLTLIGKRVEAEAVTSFVWQPEVPLAWEAGQYLEYTLPHENPDERGIQRWFTIASAPYEGTPMITTRVAPDRSSTFKVALQTLEPGATIEVDAPEGDFVLGDPTAEYVFIAGGIGVTPFHSILKEADHAGTRLKVTLLYANRSADVPFGAELDSFAAHNSNLKIIYLTDPERIDELSIRKYVPNLASSMLYVSGPEKMVKGIAAELVRLGATEGNIKMDDFPGYD